MSWSLEPHTCRGTCGGGRHPVQEGAPWTLYGGGGSERDREGGTGEGRERVGGRDEFSVCVFDRIYEKQREYDAL